MDVSNLPPIGLLAGWGNLPIVVAEAIKRSGRGVVCAAVKDHADPILEELCDATVWVGLGQLGKVKRHFQKHHATEVTMAGKIHKVRIFDRGFLWNHFPDWFCFRTFAPHLWGKKDRKDDTLLLAIVDAFAASGITFYPATDYAPELLVNFGIIAGPKPNGKLLRDIQFGWEMAKELGRLDVGQSVAVKNQAVLALEAIEGTDACIQRAGSLCKAGGFTVVKVAKPQQDMRFDVPTIGVGTLQTMVDAGASTLVLEAEKTILLDEPAVLEFAKTHRLSILAVSEDRLAEFAPSSEAA
ncbi:LpxI family protein [Bremerella sp.]|uniref:LpxI family protein n=1 Tax=Bremerella sp. TaxID=2795602 RepID=UPI00391C409E